MAIDELAYQRVGTVLNQKYTLHRLIGCGGMAAVYEASHRNGHRVAIKILHSDLAERHDFRERFLREGYVANKVDHPGAVRVLDDDVGEDDSVFLVMELLEGATLDERSKQMGGFLPVREVCVLAYRLLEVLAAAHEKGVVHRDIKPENLFLTEDGSLKVLDFGIARLLESTERQSTTRTGAVIGTPAFMAPEQALGQSSQVDGRSDLWAVGATMFALISGHLVHDAETMQEMMVRAGSMQARALRSLAQHVPPRIAEVVDRSLVFHKIDRWPDAQTMGARLEDAYLFSFGVPIVVQGVQAHPPSMRPRSIERIPGPPSVIPHAVARSAPPLSTTIGLSREKARAPRRSGARAFALVLFALGSVVAGIVVASRKEPAPSIVSPASAPTPAILPAPLPCATPAEEIPPPPAALASADAEPAVRDDSAVIDGGRTAATPASAMPAAPRLRRSKPVRAPLSSPAIRVGRPLDVPASTISTAPSATSPPAPSVVPSPAPAPPSAAPSAEPYDPTFGL